MKYILLIYGDEKVWESASKQDRERIHGGHRVYGENMAKAGVIRGGAELKSTTTATSIRFKNSQPTTTTDGPFAETKEQLGGYYVIEVDNLEQAIDWASQMPGMTNGTVEIRPMGVSQ
jgi:hypothetical protein